MPYMSIDVRKKEITVMSDEGVPQGSFKLHTGDEKETLKAKRLGVDMKYAEYALLHTKNEMNRKDKG
jgi:hypothetical protein